MNNVHTLDIYYGIDARQLVVHSSVKMCEKRGIPIKHVTSLLHHYYVSNIIITSLLCKIRNTDVIMIFCVYGVVPQPIAMLKHRQHVSWLLSQRDIHPRFIICSGDQKTQCRSPTKKGKKGDITIHQQHHIW